MKVQNRTLLVVGILLAVSALMPFLGVVGGAATVSGVLGPLLLMAAIVVAALGLQRSESLVQRDPRAVGVMIAWAAIVGVWLVASLVVTALFASADSVSEFAAWSAVPTIISVVAFIAALGSTMMLRPLSGAILPTWARPLPLYAVLVPAAGAALSQTIMMSAAIVPSDGLTVLYDLVGVIYIVMMLSTLALGAVFILLSLKLPAERTTTVLAGKEGGI